MEFNWNFVCIGIHSEGSIIRTLIGLLFLDLIYTLPKEDLLIDVFQTEPLDFHSENFYKSRQELIDQRIEQLNNEEVYESTIQNSRNCLFFFFKNIQNLAETNWNLYNLTMSSVVDWDLFQNKSILLVLKPIL